VDSYGNLVAGPGTGSVPDESAGLGARCEAVADQEKKVLTLSSQADGYQFKMLAAHDWTVLCNADTVLDARSEFLGLVVRVHLNPPVAGRVGRGAHLKEIAMREMRAMGEAGMPIKDIQFLEEPVQMATYLIDIPNRGRAMNLWTAKRRADGQMVELQVSYLAQNNHPAWLRNDPVGGLGPLMKTFELLNAAPEVDESLPPAAAPGSPTVERPVLD
jgi:hypothetical protein